MIIKDVYNQISTNYLSYKKIISFITWNYFWLGLKKMVKLYIQYCYKYKYVKALKN